MREIDNQINNLNIKGIQRPVSEEPAVQEVPQVQPETREITDLAGMPSASLGKSQISSDSIESDMKFMEKNPGVAAALTQAIDKYAQTHTEDETLQLIEKAHQEFVAKK
ncbi:hypothetical protein IJ541_06970 [bacterium]|nr:hypothetical protein [bacterium]